MGTHITEMLLSVVLEAASRNSAIREWTCLNCGAVHDRDVNAAVNIKVAGGHPETLKRTEPAPPKGARERGARNGRGGKRKTTTVAAPKETSTHLKPVQLSLFG